MGKYIAATTLSLKNSTTGAMHLRELWSVDMQTPPSRGFGRGGGGDCTDIAHGSVLRYPGHCSPARDQQWRG
eukprot:1847369-Amphidinium_carterae.1